MKAASLLLIGALSLLISCGGGGGGSSNNQQAQQADVTFDSELSSEERQALTDASTTMANIGIDGSKIKWFPEIFGGTASSNVVHYFQDRIHYLLSASTDISNRLATPGFLSSHSAVEILASNPSYALWYSSRSEQGQGLQFETNNELVPIDSTRIGVLQVGDAFIKTDDVTRDITLVHEARHSDCTGGALKSDVDRVVNGEAPSNLECGHLHATCPSGHPYAGTPACDSLPWGAYIIDAIYSVAISQACASCSDAEKQAAEINALDVLQRPLYNVDDLLSGKLGPPDMSSSNELR